MTEFRVVPKIKICSTFDEFVRADKVGQRDLILTDRFLLDHYILPKNLPCPVIAQDDYGPGEPTSSKVRAILEQAGKIDYDRVIAIGGGTAIDIAKLLVLDGVTDLLGLFEGKTPIVRTKQLMIMPTTCGTGSEVTNISIVAFEELNTKIGLANDKIFADSAVLCPEFLQQLPYQVFVFSSVDALIHAIESYLSPKANAMTRFFSVEAIRMILSGYLKIEQQGQEVLGCLMDQFLLASTYAGIAFSNAGCGLIHAMSYPLSGEYHIAHGQANHQMLMSVMRYYRKENPSGALQNLIEVFAQVFDCPAEEAFSAFEQLIERLIARKPLSDYGADLDSIKRFASQVIKTQQRLLANEYVPTSEEQMVEIYKPLL